MEPNQVQADEEVQLNNTQIAPQAFQIKLTLRIYGCQTYLTGNLEFKVAEYNV